MKKYISLNTNLRAAAKNDFEKDFSKLMNNSVFGKTMENVRNCVNIRLVTSRHIANKLAIKPNFDKNTVFCENLIAVHMKKTQLKLDKPIYLGASILDISKTLMYDFHYDYIKKNYGQKSKLLFTDTDSLCYEIQTEDFYKDISGDVERVFDTSNYSKDHLSKIPTGKNKKVIGKEQESHWDVQRRGRRKDYSGICRTENETLRVQNVGRKGRKFFLTFQTDISFSKMQ